MMISARHPISFAVQVANVHVTCLAGQRSPASDIFYGTSHNVFPIVNVTIPPRDQWVVVISYARHGHGNLRRACAGDFAISEQKAAATRVGGRERGSEADGVLRSLPLFSASLPPSLAAADSLCVLLGLLGRTMEWKNGERTRQCPSQSVSASPFR